MILSWVLRILELIYPSSGTTAFIESLSPAEFTARAPPATLNPSTIKYICSQNTPMQSIAVFVQAAFAFRAPLVRDAIHLVKYRGNRKVAALFSAILTEHIARYTRTNIDTESAGRANSSQDFILIPIPGDPSRSKERGWNQTEMICREIVKKISVEFCGNLLIKKKPTLSQTKLRREARLINLHDCFDVQNAHKAANKHIIIIDDVITTGATLREAIRALSTATPRSIAAFTIAH